MDVNVCVAKATLREAFEAVAESLAHDAAIAHVAETHRVPTEWVAEALREQA